MPPHPGSHQTYRRQLLRLWNGRIDLFAKVLVGLEHLSARHGGGVRNVLLLSVGVLSRLETKQRWRISSGGLQDKSVGWETGVFGPCVAAPQVM